MSLITARRLAQFSTGAVTPIIEAVAPSETSPATAAHEAGSYLWYNHLLYKVKAAIAIGDALVVDTNIEATTIGAAVKAASESGGGGGAATIPKPAADADSFVYDGTDKTFTLAGFDAQYMTISGHIAANAGTYTAVVSLSRIIDKWEDGTRTDLSFAWTIDKAGVALPTVDDTGLVYDGTAKAPTIGSFDSSIVTESHTAQTNAGTYNVTFSLIDTGNYKWTDTGTSAARSVPWSVAKAAGGLSIDKDSLVLKAGQTSGTVSCTVTGDGTVSAVSSDPAVASVSVSGSTVTVSSVNDSSGTATVTISVSETTNYAAPLSQTVSVSAQFVTIYGAQWDGTSTTAWSRTDAAASFVDPVPQMKSGSSWTAGSSPFDTIQPWAGMVVSERTGGTMVAIPKFYYKLTQNGNGIKVQIASGPADGFSVSPAHMDRGDGAGVRDVVYIGRYHCASDYKSKTGVKPKASITRSSARSSIHNLGSNIWQMDFATRFALWLLYIVEFADWHSQAKNGKGCGNNSSTENMGYTDAMTYHTGTTQTSRDTYGCGTQYRNIEGLWDNVYDWCDGCYYNSNGLNIILDPSNFSDSANGTLLGKPSNGYPSKFAVTDAGGFPAFYPTEASGSDSTYSCDCWDYNASSPCLCVGGNYSQYGYHGLFYVVYSSTSYSSAYIGCRLLELP